jgi:uncharacterized protein (TIGR04141 family)
VDHVREVRDPAVRATLDESLVGKIRTADTEKVWLAVPDIIEWGSVQGFRYRGFHSRGVVQDIYMPEFLAAIPSLNDLTLAHLRGWKVECIDAASGQPTEHWSVYQCLYAEVESGSEIFLLNAGKWYRVDRNFVRSVDADIQTLISQSHVRVRLPACEGESEGEYNRRAHKVSNGSYALMDQEMVWYGGRQSKIEFCDLFSKANEMVHVKKYSGSSVLSHLFAQGVVAAEAFAADAKFRAEVNKHLPNSHKLPDSAAAVDPADYKVVYGIIAKSHAPLSLPFFSKVTLRNATSRLRAMRYRVAVVGIQDTP